MIPPLYPPYGHPKVKEVRRKWTINQNRGSNAERTRCEAIQLIYQNKWECSPEFILGISSEISTKTNEVSNVQPDVEPPVTKAPDSECKKCGKPFMFNDEARKTLRPNDNYCSPGCRTKYYRSHKTKT